MVNTKMTKDGYYFYIQEIYFMAPPGLGISRFLPIKDSQENSVQLHSFLQRSMFQV